MKALSLTPPWPNAILQFGKRVENRTAWTACSYRGPILLHAAKGIGSRADFNGTVESILDIVVGPHIGTNATERLDRGMSFAAVRTVGNARQDTVRAIWTPSEDTRHAGIVGRAEIVDVIRPGALPRGVPAEQAFEEWVNVGNSSLNVDERRAQRRWWFGGFALVLDKVEPLPMVPWVGALGLFEVPDDYATRAA